MKIWMDWRQWSPELSPMRSYEEEEEDQVGVAAVVVQRRILVEGGHSDEVVGPVDPLAVEAHAVQLRKAIAGL